MKLGFRGEGRLTPTVPSRDNELTQEEMVDGVWPNDKPDRPEAIDGCFGLSCQGSRGKDPDIARREFYRGGATANSEES
jgi:hypothetical protein